MPGWNGGAVAFMFDRVGVGIPLVVGCVLA